MQLDGVWGTAGDDDFFTTSGDAADSIDEVGSTGELAAESGGGGGAGSGGSGGSQLDSKREKEPCEAGDDADVQGLPACGVPSAEPITGDDHGSGDEEDERAQRARGTSTTEA